jgi:hypothetical protein
LLATTDPTPKGGIMADVLTLRACVVPALGLWTCEEVPALALGVVSLPVDLFSLPLKYFSKR